MSDWRHLLPEGDDVSKYHGMLMEDLLRIASSMSQRNERNERDERDGGNGSNGRSCIGDAFNPLHHYR